MDSELIAEHRFGDVTAHYLRSNDGQVWLRLVPTDALDQIRTHVRAGERGDAAQLDLLVHLAVAGDPQPSGFSPGRTMRWAPAATSLRLQSQQLVDGVVVTTLVGSGLRVQHRLRPVSTEDPHTLAVECEVTNEREDAVVIEALSSFSLGALTAFADDDAPNRLTVHRFASSWSDEARPVVDTVEHLGMERSWSGSSAVALRFGQVGSMPVRSWHPVIAVADGVAGVCWGARLGWAGSWQLELARHGDDLTLSGGLADRELGHWRCTLAPGQSLAAPTAWVTVAHCVEDVWHRLLAPDRVAVQQLPAVEADLPIIVNEWCTSWGSPRHDDLLRLAETVQPWGARYLVIDAGWYRPVGCEQSWYTCMGDWEPNPDLFPHGIEATAAGIRERGLIPGLWFEMEVAGSDSQAFERIEALLHRDGVPLTTGVRRFWDLNNDQALAHLRERVFDRLQAFGYVKVDYNDTIGLGSDHPDGLGEGLRQQVLGSYRLFEELAACVPDLVVENCASGGHRLVASMLHRTSMSSFSDAHESTDVPIIAASLHRLMLARQSQIWAVLRITDSPDRLVYSLAAGFLGRLCLSGDLLDLDPAQVDLVQRATALYRQVAPIIGHGRPRLLDHTGPARRHPSGWQAVRYDHGDDALLVVHAFEGSPSTMQVPLPAGDWQLQQVFSHTIAAALTPQGVQVSGVSEFSAAVIWLRRQH